MRKAPFKHLIPDGRYKIARDFSDYDGSTYAVGETYTFLGSDFLPYEDGLTLYFSQALDMLSIRLQWREESQAAIIDKLEDYFVLVDGR